MPDEHPLCSMYCPLSRMLPSPWLMQEGECGKESLILLSTHTKVKDTFSQKRTVIMHPF